MVGTWGWMWNWNVPRAGLRCVLDALLLGLLGGFLRLALRRSAGRARFCSLTDLWGEGCIFVRSRSILLGRLFRGARGGRGRGRW